MVGPEGPWKPSFAACGASLRPPGEGRKVSGRQENRVVERRGLCHHREPHPSLGRDEVAAEMSRLEQPGLEILAWHRGVVPHCMTADRIWASRGYGLLARDAAGPWRSLGQVPQPAWRRVCAQSELVTLGLRLGVHGVVRLASGALLVCVSGGLLRGGEGGPWQTVMEFEGFRKPARQGLAQDRKGRIFLAQYARNHNRAQAMHLWRSEDDGRSFQVLRRFEPGEVRHLHFVQEDPVDGSLWLGTGDRSDESSLRRSTDGGETWDVVGRGSQKWRAMSLAFLTDAIYYGTDAGSDSPEYTNQIVRLDRRTGEAVEVRARPGPGARRHRDPRGRRADRHSRRGRRQRGRRLRPRVAQPGRRRLARGRLLARPGRNPGGSSTGWPSSYPGRPRRRTSVSCCAACRACRWASSRPGCARTLRAWLPAGG